MDCSGTADGWLGGEEEGIDLRRVVDVHHHRSIPQMLVNRGTVSPALSPSQDSSSTRSLIIGASASRFCQALGWSSPLQSLCMSSLSWWQLWLQAAASQTHLQPELMIEMLMIRV